MRSAARRDQQDWLMLKDRALTVAAEGITIADARDPDRPLIYVNHGFEILTGYTAAEVIGRNCNFLQSEESDPDTVATMRRALRAGEECTVEILNRRKDGSPFWNRLSISPVHDETGQLTHFIGIQSDITERVEAEDALRAANDQLTQELREAAAIQRFWLPEALHRMPGLDIAWRFRPCEELAGDALNVIKLDENRVGLYILDVSGHGVPAALLSASMSRWISPLPERSVLFVPDAASPTGFVPAEPAEVMRTLNRQFDIGAESGKFFTILYAIFDRRTRELRYATGGHPPPVIISDGEARLGPAARGLPIGTLPEFDRFTERVVQLQPGDRVLLYTDGAFEAIDEDEREIGERRLLQELSDLHGTPCQEALDLMIRRIEEWCPGEQPQDDVTLLAFDVLPD